MTVSESTFPVQTRLKDWQTQPVRRYITLVTHSLTYDHECELKTALHRLSVRQEGQVVEPQLVRHLAELLYQVCKDKKLSLPPFSLTLLSLQRCEDTPRRWNARSQSVP